MLRKLLQRFGPNLLYALLVQLVILFVVLGPTEAPILRFAHLLVVD